MTNQDTTKLLKETDLGLQMAIYSFDQLLERVENPALKKLITESRNDHKRLQDENNNLMKAYDVIGEEPGAMAKTMAWMETNVKMTVENSDRVIADIITNGCDMGSKKLRKYRNEYTEAEEPACDTAKKLIALEEDLRKDLQLYL